MQSQSNSRYKLYTAMSSSCQDKFSMRHEPARTKPTLEKLVVAARKKTPCFGARRLVEAFDLPVGKGAAHRILRDARLVRKRPRKHKRKRKADPRAFKANHAPLTRLQMDTKYLTDIPHYWPQMHAQSLPRFQYTIRCESTTSPGKTARAPTRPQSNCSAKKTSNLHPLTLLLHPCLLDSHMGQLLSGPPAQTHHRETAAPAM